MEIKVSIPLGKEVFSAMNGPFCCTWPHWNQAFFEDFEISREFLITSLKKIHSKCQKSSQKPSLQFGQVQRKGPFIAENTSLPVGKLYFNFRTKESSIPLQSTGK